jgi:hypothetical protein
MITSVGLAGTTVGDAGTWVGVGAVKVIHPDRTIAKMDKAIKRLSFILNLLF